MRLRDAQTPSGGERATVPPLLCALHGSHVSLSCSPRGVRRMHHLGFINTDVTHSLPSWGCPGLDSNGQCFPPCPGHQMLCDLSH